MWCQVGNALDANTVKTQRGMLIGGERRAGSAGSYPIYNPATEEIVGFAPEASVEDVHAAVAAAAEALPAWSATRLSVRLDALRRIAVALRARSETLATLIAAESGCLLAAAYAMVERSAQRFDRFAELASGMGSTGLAPEVRPTGSGENTLAFGEVIRRPHGVVACITPFNFPIIGAASKIAPAVVMGNTVVFKPAPQDPLAILELAEICHEIELPPGVVNIVTGSLAETGRALVAAADVDMVSFTGSTAAGVEIYRASADRMRRVLLELGGKGALIVRRDADLNAAVETLSRVWTYYSGQWCAAPTRAIVHRDVLDEVLARLTQIGRALRPGDPQDPESSMGPIISASQRDRIRAMVARAIEQGATDLIRGSVCADGEPGYFVSPVLLSNCRRDMDIVRNEVFGPVLSVLAFDDDEEAIELANDTEFGLTNYIYSADVAVARSMALRLRSGAVLVNLSTPHEGLPFGGVGMSGVGRDGGLFALEAYSEAQGVAVGL